MLLSRVGRDKLQANVCCWNFLLQVVEREKLMQFLNEKECTFFVEIFQASITRTYKQNYHDYLKKTFICTIHLVTFALFQHKQ